MSLTAEQLGDLKRQGYRVKRVRNDWQQASNGRSGWAGGKWSSVERAWQDAGHAEGLCSAPAPL